MRRFFTWCTTAIAVACMSHACKYDDSALTGRVDDLEGRIEKLEELCRQMNTNISSLQTIVTALQSNDYVTGVTPILEEGTEIGYTITFGQNNPITIYHGQKGETGATGNDGHTPTIGVEQDTDGNYYWTLDGNWLTDDVGNKIKAQGESGAQGITPQLKIENGYWYVSYDNQQTWVSVGPATSEGGSGNSMFERVTQDDENVYFTLIGGETITLPKASSLAIQFEEGTSLQFNNIGEEKTIHYTITGGNAPLITVSMQDNNNCCSLELTETSATTGTIHIRAIAEAKSRIIVSIFDNDHSIAAAIDITISV
ncbi:PL29 family lyase N-terminal domain-containing protein, partial [Millionella massiliensis]|uniref:PL29 family lyase N-terminal domain-containing protein n=1 Tax=Millionella massiliensis TaxID=1871023 RepID=UPI0023A8E47F